MKKKRTESGQSILEFLIMLPILIGLVVILVRVNTAMQISIVNQQYARAHTLWLAFNSAEYPQYGIRESNFQKKGYNRMVIGVADNAQPDDDSGIYRPLATTQYIVRKQKVRDSSPAQEEPTERDYVRIRNTISLCTQSNVMFAEGASQPISPALLRKHAESGAEGAKVFQFCRSPIDE